MDKAIVETYMNHCLDNSEHSFHRYKSWDHCYKAFGENKYDIDTLALHLAVYLASWGMYRGSTFILESDYKVHKEVVKMVQDKRSDLRGLKVDKLNDKVGSIVELHDMICDYYNINLKEYSKAFKDPKPVKTSDIMTTKIMLGTLACVPAYDTFLRTGLTKHNIGGGFSGKNLTSKLAAFALKNKETIDELTRDYGYPNMKILDMYFWQLGYNIEKEKFENNKKYTK